MANPLPLLSLLLLVSVGAAQAQTPLKPTYSSRDEYRVCLREEDELKRQRDVLREESKDHSAKLKRLQDEMRSHVATQPKVGASDDVVVDAFNEKIEVLNARVAASNKEAERLNLELYKFNSRIALANQRCAGMVVTSADHDAVHKERVESAKSR